MLARLGDKKKKVPPGSISASPLSLPPSPFTFFHLCIGPACHCGRSRPISPLIPPSTHTTSTHPQPRPGLSLWQVPPRPSHFFPYLTSIYYSSLRPCLPISQVSLILSSPSPLPLLHSLFSCCHPARVGRHGRSKVILPTFCHKGSTSDSLGNMLFNDYKFLHWRVWLRFILQIMNYNGWPLPGCASPWIAIGLALATFWQCETVHSDAYS